MNMRHLDVEWARLGLVAHDMVRARAMLPSFRAWTIPEKTES